MEKLVPEDKPQTEPQTEGPKRIRVVSGTQINVEGTLYSEGETINVPESLRATAAAWVEAGWAEVVEAKAKTKTKPPALSTESLTGA